MAVACEVVVIDNTACEEYCLQPEGVGGVKGGGGVGGRRQCSNSEQSINVFANVRISTSFSLVF